MRLPARAPASQKERNTMYLISFVNASNEEFNAEFNTFDEAQAFWDAEADKYIFGRMEDLGNNEIIWTFES